jgi:hypothetical protein
MKRRKQPGSGDVRARAPGGRSVFAAYVQRAEGRRLPAAMRGSVGFWLFLTACSAGAPRDPALPDEGSAPSPASGSSTPAASAESVTVEPPEPTPWWKTSTPCPEGAELKGSAPPEGQEIWCEKGGKPHGPKTTFYPNGQRELSRTYYQGKSEGRFTVWHDTGSVAEEGQHRNGQLEGRWQGKQRLQEIRRRRSAHRRNALPAG